MNRDTGRRLRETLKTFSESPLALATCRQPIALFAWLLQPSLGSETCQPFLSFGLSLQYVLHHSGQFVEIRLPLLVSEDYARQCVQGVYNSRHALQKVCRSRPILPCSHDRAECLLDSRRVSLLVPLAAIGQGFHPRLSGSKNQFMGRGSIHAQAEKLLKTRH